jgi:pyruvate/2-oxoglutarate dehydrogenase complex dihydrolipoamide dehydrogenase (E3) component
MAEQVDAIIIGSGQAGNPLAAAFAGKGKRVVVIESKHVGGTCVNEGCTPTKTMVASAKIAHQARRGPEFGVHTGSVTVKMAEVRKRKREVVDVWRSGSEKKLEEQKNIWAAFPGRRRFP